jgi:Amt family ammonium transporter
MRSVALWALFLTGIFATSKVNTNLKDMVGHPLWLEQLKAIGVTLFMAVVGTVILGFLVKSIIGLIATEEVQTIGLDLAEHGEEAYHEA